MNTIYYFDEAGFTGSDLSNVDQPYFCLGSAKFTDDEILHIKNDLSVKDDEELHFKKLYNHLMVRSESLLCCHIT